VNLPQLLLIGTALAAGTLIPGGCSRPPLSGPPELRLGREECAECGMLVVENRFSAAALVERSGEKVYEYFDDIGCMLDRDDDRDGSSTVDARYVHDHATGAWLLAEHALYVRVDHRRLQTPMGSGLAAFGDRAEAEKLRASFGGDHLDWDSVCTARRTLKAGRRDR
jgi:copper chaperone NosL